MVSTEYLCTPSRDQQIHCRPHTPLPPCNVHQLINHAIKNFLRRLHLHGPLPSAIWYTHCNEKPIYVFLHWELRGLSPNFHIHVSVSDLYISSIGPHISCNRIGRSIVGIYKSLTDTCMWKLGRWPHNSFSGNICFEFSVLFLGSVYTVVRSIKV
jgi:hypothetical protein